MRVRLVITEHKLRLFCRNERDADRFAALHEFLYRVPARRVRELSHSCCGGAGTPQVFVARGECEGHRIGRTGKLGGRDERAQRAIYRLVEGVDGGGFLVEDSNLVVGCYLNPARKTDGHTSIVGRL